MITNVEFVRKEISKKLPVWQVISDCLEQNVKSKGLRYLPKPNAADKSKENEARYQAYLMRAVFYDVTSRTLNGLVGQAYANDPVLKVPSQLEAVVKDANGKKITLIQSSKEASEFVLSKGRCGLFVDYPMTGDAPATVADITKGLIAPTINIYGPENIINWDVKKVGSKQLLSLVVLVEDIQVRNGDNLELKDEKQYRVLRLNDANEYTQTLYKPNQAKSVSSNSAKDKGTFADTVSTSDETVITVKGADGKPLTEIPFTFIGCVNNDPGVDPAPLANLAELNIAHYRNSADYEESCFIVGQPTYVIAGLTAEWLKTQLNGVILVGSRGGLALPVGATAEILQPEPNSMPKEAMEHKEKQMVAIGAKLVEDKKVQQTATAANIENTSETSILATACKNVSAAYTQALMWCSMLVGVSETECKFELNTDFAINKMSPEEVNALIASWLQGAITYTEMRNKLTESGIATLTVEEAKKETDEEVAKKADAAADAAGKLAKAVPPVPVGNPKNNA